MSKAVQTVSHPQVISSFGTSFWVSGDSAADYILHPVFLRFTMLCIGIYALLDQSNDAQLLIGWQLLVLWLSIAISVISGYVLIGGFCLRLVRKGVLRRLYTPFMMLPIVLLAEMTEQGIVVLLQAGDWKPLPMVLTDATRDMLVIMLMDVMHVQYVVPNHPLALTTQPGHPAPARFAAEVRSLTAPPVAAEEQTSAMPQASLAAEDAAEDPQERGMVRIADRAFAIGDIQSVRTEDHYLNVVTRTARSMLRAKLSDIVALHDGRYGLQINRSQWVAFAAIEAVKDEDNGQVTLQLVNGDAATVSRTRRLMFMQLYNSQLRRSA